MFYPCYSTNLEIIAIFWKRSDEGKKAAGIWTISRKDSTQKCIIKERITLIGWSEDGSELYGYYSARSNKIYKIDINTAKTELFITLPFLTFGIKIFQGMAVQYLYRKSPNNPTSG